MTFLFILFALFIGATCYSFQYKVKMRIKISKENGTFSPIIGNFFYLTDVLPMRLNNVPTEEIEKRKKANRAIYIFYFSIVACFGLIFFVQNVLHINNLNPPTKNNYYDSTTKPLTDSEKVQLNDSFKKELQKSVLH